MNSTLSPLYASKKRRKPQTKKDKEILETKSNPSKRHRDRLNLELENLVKLIPFPEDIINKLDKLSILRLAVSYLRNKNYHKEFSSKDESSNKAISIPTPPKDRSKLTLLNTNITSQLCLQALNGFIAMVTQDYNVFYISETILDLLGFPQCDILNTSMLDLIHTDDRPIFKKNMRIDQSMTFTNDTSDASVPEYARLGISSELFSKLSNQGFMYRSFICRLRCLVDNSSGFLALHFTGHLRLTQNHKPNIESDQVSQPSLALFFLATPLESPSILEIRTKNFIFRTKHRLDYTPLGIDAKGRAVLGYTEYQLKQRSGYEFVHSADMMHCANSHTKLMRVGESGITIFRILHKENKWLWVTASAKLVYRQGKPEYIVSTHRPIPDQEGFEHMKKRNDRFRFEFTGHAILYDDYSSSNKMQSETRKKSHHHSSSSTTEKQYEPPSKRTKLDNNNQFKPSPNNQTTKQPSLLEAQNLQPNNIYMEENERRSVYDDMYKSVTSGLLSLEQENQDLLSLNSNDFGTIYYSIGSGNSKYMIENDAEFTLPQETEDYIDMETPRLNNNRFDRSSIPSTSSQSSSNPPSTSLENLEVVEPPPLCHPPVSNGSRPMIMQYTQESPEILMQISPESHSSNELNHIVNPPYQSNVTKTQQKSLFQSNQNIQSIRNNNINTNHSITNINFNSQPVSSPYWNINQMIPPSMNQQSAYQSNSQLQQAPSNDFMRPVSDMQLSQKHQSAYHQSHQLMQQNLNNTQKNLLIPSNIRMRIGEKMSDYTNGNDLTNNHTNEALSKCCSVDLLSYPEETTSFNLDQVEMLNQTSNISNKATMYFKENNQLSANGINRTMNQSSRRIFSSTLQPGNQVSPETQMNLYMSSNNTSPAMMNISSCGSNITSDEFVSDFSQD